MTKKEKIIMQENNFNYHVYPEQTVRVITTTDAKCEADDQYAIVHHGSL